MIFVSVNKKSIVKGALILTVAGIITRLLGFVYRVYMTNILGAEGMGLYQLIMPIYGLAWSIACSGFNTAVSKLVASEHAKGEHGNTSRILKISVAITTCLGLVVGVVLFIFASEISMYFFKDTRTVLSMRIMAAAFPLMAAGTCIRGYFLGLQETLIPAINQVLEQVVRMIVIYFLASLFVSFGIEIALAIAVTGIVCEELVSFIYIYISYGNYRAKLGSGGYKARMQKKPSMSVYASLALILSMALPLTGNRVAGSLLATVENVLIPQRLMAFGMSSKQAMSVFGQISGMAMPLIFFPTALLTSLSITLVPAVSEAMAIKNYNGISRTVSKSVLFASVTGIGAACLFMMFPDEIGYLIYKQPIGQMLFALGLMCPFMYMQIVLSGVLNGLGFQVFIFRNSMITSLINIGFIYFLIPYLGIWAFLSGWFIGLLMLCYLDIQKIRNTIRLDIDYANWFFKPILCAAAAGLSVKWLYGRMLDVMGMGNMIRMSPQMGMNMGLQQGIAVLIAIGALVLIYLVLVILTGCIEAEEIRGRLRVGSGR